MSYKSDTDQPILPKGLHHIITPTTLVFELGEKHQLKAQECLKQSGRLTFSFTEITATELPQTLLHNGVEVD